MACTSLHPSLPQHPEPSREDSCSPRGSPNPFDERQPKGLHAVSGPQKTRPPKLTPSMASEIRAFEMPVPRRDCAAVSSTRRSDVADNVQHPLAPAHAPVSTLPGGAKAAFGCLALPSPVLVGWTRPKGIVGLALRGVARTTRLIPERIGTFETWRDDSRLMRASFEVVPRGR